MVLQYSGLQIKVYWNLLLATFSSHWDPITHNVHLLEILPSMSPMFKDDVIVPPPQLPPTFESTTNQAQRTTSESTKRKNGGKGEEEKERVRKEGDEEGFKRTADTPGDVSDIIVTS